jgi:hypothetical protein
LIADADHAAGETTVTYARPYFARLTSTAGRGSSGGMRRGLVVALGIALLVAFSGESAAMASSVARTASVKTCTKKVRLHGKVVKKRVKCKKRKPKPAPDFSLSASPASLTVQAGGTPQTTTITVVPANGFSSSSVTYTTSSVPGVKFDVASTGDSTSTLTATAAVTASPGSTTLTVTGSGSGKTHTVVVPLTITAPPVGSMRGNPFPLGTTATVPDWQFRINSVTFDAWPLIQAANLFNDPPAPGWEDVLISVTMTYTGAWSGAATGTPWLDFSSLEYVGSSNVAYTDYDLSHECGVPPDPWLGDYDTVFPGGSVTGNECFQIEIGDAGSLEGFWDSASPGPWFALR